MPTPAEIKFQSLLGRGFTPEQASTLTGVTLPEAEPTPSVEGPNRSYLGNLGASAYQGAVSNLAGQAKFFGANETAAYLQNLAAEVKQDPEFAAVQDKLNNAKTVTEGLKILATHPKFAGTMGAQVLGQFGPALVSMLVTKTAAGFAGVGAGVAGAAGTGAAAAQAGTSSSGNEELNILYDLTGTTDVEAAKQLLKENPQLADDIQTVANRRGVMDGLATLLGIGASGKFASKMGTEIWTVKGALSEALGQASIGAGSEAIAQNITMRGTPSDIAAEIFFEGVSAPVEATAMRIMNNAAPVTHKDKTTPTEEPTGFEEVQDTEEPVTSPTTTPTEPAPKAAASGAEKPPRSSTEEKRVLTAVEKSMLTGTEDQRLKRLSQHKMDSLVEEAKKRNISPFRQNDKGVDVRKTKAELAKEILAAEKVTPATAPNLLPDNTVPMSEGKLSLPRDLSGAKPRFNVGEDSNVLDFESDVDKALFIISQKKKSNRDADYLKWLQDTTGMSRSELDAEAATLRLQIKDAAKKNTGGGNLRIPKFFEVPNAPVGRPAAPQPMPVASVFTQKLRNLGLNPKITLKPETETALQERISTAKDNTKSPADRAAALNDIYTGLRQVGFFEGITNLRQGLTAAHDFVKNSFPDVESKDVETAMRSAPAVAAALTREATTNAVLNKDNKASAEDSTPPFVAKVKQVIGDTTASELDPSNPTSTKEQVDANEAANNPVVEYAVSISDEYQDVVKIVNGIEKGTVDIDNLDWSKSKGGLSMVNRARVLFNSISHLIRRYPVYAPFFWAAERKSNFVKEFNTELHRQLQTIVDRYGEDTSSKAYYVMDEMSAPWNAEIQKPEYASDGRLMFKTSEGKKLLADKRTTAAFKDLQKFHKEMLDLMKMTIAPRLRLAGIDLKDNFTLSDLNTLKDSMIGEKPSTIAMVDNAIEAVTQIDRIKKSTDGVYFPHTRKKGPYAVSFYVRNEDGSVGDLRYFTGIEKKKYRDEPDSTQLQKVIEDAQAKAESLGEQWVTFKGGSLQSTSPFLMNPKNMKEMLRKTKSTPALNELVSSLLFAEGIERGTIEEVLDGLGGAKDIEKMTEGLRERGGYYGYETENRLGSVSDALGARAYSLGNFIFGNHLNKLHETSRNMAVAKSVPKGVITHFDKYKDHVTSLDDANAQVRQLAYIWFMFGNLSSAIMQSFTPAMVTVPMMKRYMSASKALKWNTGRSTAATIKDVGKALSAFTPKLNAQQRAELYAKKLNWSPEEIRFLSNLDRKGYLSESQQADVFSSEISRKYTKSTQEKILSSKAGQAVSGAIPYMERAARMTSFRIIYDTFKDPAALDRFLSDVKGDNLWQSFLNAEYGGQPTLEAAVAYNMLEYHGFYGKTNRPEFLNNLVGATIFPLTSYAIHMMELLSRTMIQDGKISPQGLKVIALMALAAWQLGGIQAMPGYQVIDWLVKFLSDKLGARKVDAQMLIDDVLKDVGLGKEARQFAMYGPLQTVLGVNIGTRIGINPPVTSTILKVIDPPANTSALDYAGAPGAIAQPVIDGLKRWRENQPIGENLTQFAAEALPAPLKNAVKGAQIATGDLRTASGNKLSTAPGEPGSETTYGDVVRQGFGFTPLNVAQVRRDIYEQNANLAGAGKQGTNVVRQAAKTMYDLRSGNLTQEEASKKMAALALEYVKQVRDNSPETSPSEALANFREGLKKQTLAEINPKAARIMAIPKDKRARILADEMDIDEVE